MFTPAGLKEWSKPEAKAYCDVSKANDWKVVQDMTRVYERGVVMIASVTLAREGETARQILVKKSHIRVRDPKLFWRTDGIAEKGGR